ncbi:hypothetical protein V6N11_083754 [Hibiscus sabdariffa]|uniref:Uncharacterized protein n=1 Tax=Hibiscus sabdariffa TaxID=183260 RepID=A0ABR2QCI5_9ROSI
MFAAHMHRKVHNCGPYDVKPTKKPAPCNKFATCHGVQLLINHFALCKRGLTVEGALVARGCDTFFDSIPPFVITRVLAEFHFAGHQPGQGHGFLNALYASAFLMLFGI